MISLVLSDYVYIRLDYIDLWTNLPSDYTSVDDYRGFGGVRSSAKAGDVVSDRIARGGAEAMIARYEQSRGDAATSKRLPFPRTTPWEPIYFRI